MFSHWVNLNLALRFHALLIMMTGGRKAKHTEYFFTCRWKCSQHVRHLHSGFVFIDVRKIVIPPPKKTCNIIQITTLKRFKKPWREYIQRDLRWHHVILNFEGMRVLRRTYTKFPHDILVSMSMEAMVCLMDACIFIDFRVCFSCSFLHDPDHGLPLPPLTRTCHNRSVPQYSVVECQWGLVYPWRKEEKEKATQNVTLKHISAYIPRGHNN